MTTLRRSGALAVSAAVVAAMSSCSDQDADDATLTVWNLENLPERMAVAEEIAEGFTEETGIEVDLVAIDENDLSQVVTSSAAAGELPDVIGAAPMAAVHQMASNELVDTESAAEVIEELDSGTFNDRALELIDSGGTPLAVPSDAWTQLIVYRADVFDEAGLEAPTSYDAIQEAARTLDGEDMDGIALATDPGDAFTQQSFEHVALANGCELVEESGTVVLDSPECAEAFSFYADLVTNHSTGGEQTVDSTRAAYFSGRAAMVVWSSFILDELAGLRDDALPTCPECEDDPQWLADNSGVVTALQGPDGEEPAQFGEMTSWVVTASAQSEEARSYVHYMLDEGYTEWFGMAAEGKFPVRTGTPEDPELFLSAWEDSEIGVDTRMPLAEALSEETSEQLRGGVDHMDRWGITEGHGELVGAMLGELPVPKAISAQAGGEIDDAEAARRAHDDVLAIQESLQ
jgi:multiple sugar transport system substrate-binding protein